MQLASVRAALRDRRTAGLDYFLNWAGTEFGFLSLAAGLRFAILLGLTFRFGVNQPLGDQSDLLDAVLRLALWSYFFFCVGVMVLAQFWPQQFVSMPSRGVQVVVDGMVITFFFALTPNLYSDLYLGYLLPVLILARFFRPRWFLASLALVVVVAGLTWWYVKPPALLSDPRYWAEVFLPRTAFMAALTFFYLVYYRRRRTSALLQNRSLKLDQTFRGLRFSVLSVDEGMRIREMDAAFSEKHGAGIAGKTCAEALCPQVASGVSPCDTCPLNRALVTGQMVIRQEQSLVDKQGVLYPAVITATPMRDSQDNVVGAMAVVENLAERDSFLADLHDYAAGVDSTVEALTQEHRQQLETATREMTATLRATAAMISSDRPFSVAEIVRGAAELLDCQAGDVRRAGLEPSTGRRGLLLYHSFGFDPPDVARRKFVDLERKTLVVRVYEAHLADQEVDIQLRPDQVQLGHISRKYSLRTMASFPLISGGACLGTFSLYRRVVLAFSPRDLQFGQALANVLAAVIANHALVERAVAEEAARQQVLEANARFVQQLAPKTSVGDLVQRVAGTLLTAIQAETTAVFLLKGNSLVRVGLAGLPAAFFPEEHYQAGQGLTGRVLLAALGERYGRFVRENNVEESSGVVLGNLTRYKQALPSRTVQHLLAVPLNGSQGTYGVMRAVNKLTAAGQLDPEGFSERDLNLMTTVGAIVAVGLENAQRSQEQASLLELGQVVTAGLSPEAALTKSLRRAVDLLEAEAGSVLLPDAKTGELVIRFTAGTLAPACIGLSLPPERGIANAVFASGEPALVADVRLDERFYPEIDAQTGFVTRSILAVPVKGQVGIMAVIEVLNKRHGAFTENDLGILSALSVWLAIAVDNARLFAEEQERRHEAEVLRETMQKLSSTLELDEILDTVLDQLERVVPFDSASVYLREGVVLRLRRHRGFPRDEHDQLDWATLDTRQNQPFLEMQRTLGPVLIPDTALEQRLDPIIGATRIRSWVGAPFVFRGHVLGHISVDSWLPNRYARAQASLVMAFAQQAATALTNANMYESQLRQKENLAELNSLLLGLESALPLETKAGKISAAAARLLGCEFAAVALFDDSRREYTVLPEATYGLDQRLARLMHFRREDVQFLAKDMPFEMQRALRSAPPGVWFTFRLLRRLGVQELVVRDLGEAERPIGMLFAGTQSGRGFTDGHRALFVNLAKHAAVALQNAYLQADVERRADLLVMLHQISIAGQLTSDLDRILNIILTGVTANYGLRYNRAVVLLLDESRESLVGHTGIGQLDEAEAHYVWENLRSEHQTLEGYMRQVLDQGVPGWTPVHYLAQDLRFPVNWNGGDVFSQALRKSEVATADPRTDADSIDPTFLREFDPGRFALAPLRARERVIGLLVVDNKYTGDALAHLDLLSTCASLAAAAIERYRLYADQQAQIRVLQGLQAASKKLAQMTDLKEVVCCVNDSAHTLLGADYSYLVPYQADARRLQVELAARAGDPIQHQDEPHHTKHGLTAQALSAASGLVLIPDISARPDLDSNTIRKNQFQSVAVARLEFDKEVVGFYYADFLHRHDFPPLEQEMLAVIAHHAALAIHNARVIAQRDALVMQRERNRWQQDLHDALGPFHTSVVLPLQQWRNRGWHTYPSDGSAQLDRLVNAARHHYTSIERIMNAMENPMLMAEGLPAALRLLLRMYSPVPIDLSVEADCRLPYDIELALYRIAQEAISNIVRHADLTGLRARALVTVRLTAQTSDLIVIDQGVGFSPQAVEGDGLGLVFIEQWATKIGAQWRLRAAPGQGTQIRVTLGAGRNHND